MPYPETNQRIQQGQQLSIPTHPNTQLNDASPRMSPVPTVRSDGQYKRTQNIINALAPFSTILASNLVKPKSDEEIFKARLAYAQRRMDDDDDFVLADHPVMFQGEIARLQGMHSVRQRLSKLRKSFINNPGAYASSKDDDTRQHLLGEYEKIANEYVTKKPDLAILGLQDKFDSEKKRIIGRMLATGKNMETIIQKKSVN